MQYCQPGSGRRQQRAQGLTIVQALSIDKFAAEGNPTDVVAIATQIVDAKLAIRQAIVLGTGMAARPVTISSGCVGTRSEECLSLMEERRLRELGHP